MLNLHYFCCQSPINAERYRSAIPSQINSTALPRNSNGEKRHGDGILNSLKLIDFNSKGKTIETLAAQKKPTKWLSAIISSVRHF